MQGFHQIYILVKYWFIGFCVIVLINDWNQQKCAHPQTLFCLFGLKPFTNHNIIFPLLSWHGTFCIQTFIGRRYVRINITLATKPITIMERVRALQTYILYNIACAKKSNTPWSSCLEHTSFCWRSNKHQVLLQTR